MCCIQDAHKHDTKAGTKRLLTSIGLLSCAVLLACAGLLAFGNLGSRADDKQPQVLQSQVKDELAESQDDEREPSTTVQDRKEILQKAKALASKKDLNPNAITAVKELSDFGGYNYFVIEFAPAGYLICDNQFLYMIEMGESAPSPYEGEQGNLLYLGPQEYYTMPSVQPRNGYKFEHTVLGQAVETENLELLQNRSTQMHDIAIQKQERQLQYEQQMASLSQEQQNLSRASSGTRTAQLKNQWFLKDSDRNYNYNNGQTWNWEFGGNCGYVAASMVIDYWADTKGYTNLMPADKYWYGRNAEYREEEGKAFVKEIQGIAPGPTIGLDVQLAMSIWAGKRGYGLSANILFKPAKEIMYGLVASDRPVIMGGYFVNPETGKRIMHAVTIHKVTKWEQCVLGIHIAYADYVYWVNFGWDPENNSIGIESSFLNLGTDNLFGIYY